MSNALNLIAGKKYKVIKPFTDFDNDIHEISETWIFLETNFLPYHNGLTLHVLPINSSEATIYRLEWTKEGQGEIIDNFIKYVEEC